jgi:hypothetical protein
VAEGHWTGRGDKRNGLGRCNLLERKTYRGSADIQAASQEGQAQQVSTAFDGNIGLVSF